MANNPYLKTKLFGEPINKIFEVFIEQTLLRKNSYLSITSPITEPIFTPTNMQVLVEAYVKKYDAGNGTFYEKLEKQLDGTSDEARAVFANLLWLKSLFQEKKIDTQPDKEGRGGECGKDTIEKIKKCTVGFSETAYLSNNGCAPYGSATIYIDAEMTDLVLLYHNLVQRQFNGSSDDEKLKEIKKYIICWCLDINEDGSVPVNKKGIRSATYSDTTIGIPEERKCPKALLPLHNMLLYACNSEYYDNIAVSGDKEKIAKAFKGIWTEDDLNRLPADFYDNEDGYNKKLYIVYKKLEKAGEKPQIYFEPYRSMWRNEGTELDAIKFKKALVLYGPPGTSKTYTAKDLAKTIIRQLNYANEVNKYLEDLNNGEIEKRVHRLQLHPNYTYEDFVWGYQIENEKYNKDGAPLAPNEELRCVGNKTTPKKGYFLRLLDEIREDNKDTLEEIEKRKNEIEKKKKEIETKKEEIEKKKEEKENRKKEDGETPDGKKKEELEKEIKKLEKEISGLEKKDIKELEKKITELEKGLKIHVLILDEINRVDLSRLFGELFSAIENRDEAIDLPVVIEGLMTKKVLGQEVSQISIPQNLYIIGTMNEIDFSLERVDFALRRRFIWKYYGFDQEALCNIIEQKKSDYKWSKPKPEEEDLVDYVNRCNALNNAIANDPDLGNQFEIGHTFYGELVDIWATKPRVTQLNVIQDTLWEISIGPMIEAYLGNCDAETKKKKLEDFKKEFIPELKKDDGKATEE